MAPELQGFGDTSQHRTPIDFQAADMWALGEIAFQMLTSEHAFPNPRAFAFYCTGKDECPALKLMPSVGESAAYFIANLMAVQPHLRAKASDALDHRWMLPSHNEELGLATTHSSDMSSVQVDQVGLSEESPLAPLGEASASWRGLRKLERNLQVRIHRAVGSPNI